MSEIEVREIIRGDYGSKHYEILQKEGKTSIYDYGLGRFLAKDQVEILQNTLTED